jgi:hypothetical protein
MAQKISFSKSSCFSLADCFSESRIVEEKTADVAWNLIGLDVGWVGAAAADESVLPGSLPLGESVKSMAEGLSKGLSTSSISKAKDTDTDL